MTSKLVVNTIEADTGISSVSFASSISLSSTSKFHFSAAGIDIDADTNINRPAAGVIGFNINSSEKARINSSGQLGIGITNPQGRLHISSGTSGDCQLIIESDTDNNNETDNPRILLRQDGGQDLNSIGLNFSASASTDNNSLYLASSGSQSGIIFLTGTSDGYTNATERLRIDSSGRLLLGTVRTYGTGPYYDDICINNSNGSGSAGGSGIDLISKSDNYGAIIFSNESQHERGYIKFEHNSGVNKLRFGTLGADKWEILSTGHLLPSTNEVFDIGSNSQRVRNGYFDDLNIKGNIGVGNTTTVGRNAGVSTATGSIIYNSNHNALEVYNGSEWKAISSKSSSFNMNYLVVGGGGGGGGYFRGGGGGAGALRTNWNNESQGGGQSSAAAKSISIGTAYSIILGAGGAGAYNSAGNTGGTTTFDDIVSNGGTGGARYERAAPTNSGNGSGGGGGGHTGTLRAGGAAGTYGYAGGNGSDSGSTQCGGGGGGAAAAGGNGGGGGTDGDGGAALNNTITGSTVAYAGGAGGGNYGGGNQTIGGGAGAPAGGVGSGSAPGQNASIANRGSGGGGAGGSNVSGGTGSAGVVILRFPTIYTATVTGGVTSSSATVGTDTVLTITATSDSSQTVTFS